MTARQAKKLKKGDKIVLKRRKHNFTTAIEIETVDYVSYNPHCGLYFIGTVGGWGHYHRDVELAETTP